MTSMRLGHAGTPLLRTAGHPLARVLRSEAIKLRSLRSLVWLAVAGGVAQAVLGPLQALGLLVAQEQGDGVRDLDGALSLALSGTGTACVIFGILGVLSVTSEYPQQAIRGTFIATPRRSLVVAAKALAYAAAAGAAAAVSTGVALAGALPSLAAYGFHLDVLDPDVVRVSAMSVVYLVLWGLYGQVLGWVLRSTVGSTMALIGLFFVVPSLVALLPRAAVEVVYPLLPSQAAAATLRTAEESMSVGALAGSLLSLAYVVWAVGLATKWVNSHDA